MCRLVTLVLLKRSLSYRRVSKNNKSHIHLLATTRWWSC